MNNTSSVSLTLNNVLINKYETLKKKKKKEQVDSMGSHRM